MRPIIFLLVIMVLVYFIACNLQILSRLSLVANSSSARIFSIAWLIVGISLQALRVQFSYLTQYLLSLRIFMAITRVLRLIAPSKTTPKPTVFPFESNQAIQIKTLQFSWHRPNSSSETLPLKIAFHCLVFSSDLILNISFIIFLLGYFRVNFSFLWKDV